MSHPLDFRVVMSLKLDRKVQGREISLAVQSMNLERPTQYETMWTQRIDNVSYFSYGRSSIESPYQSFAVVVGRKENIHIAPLDSYFRVAVINMDWRVGVPERNPTDSEKAGIVQAMLDFRAELERLLNG